ncbi:splicing factor U2af large subunit B [Selaginella moellendorffii]|uniref:splicing factor U2af large subunit B n=1 Tax=Selaginella moellendorffii TaxID=88036 RepID=UPI000D1D0076|nr:splicing factor U2af large subunit B [Selaginella moellendorffii]|eukprot:XP_002988434.2 splicing factor U2af large subunit B [Selaginella moellendorffii]
MAPRAATSDPSKPDGDSARNEVKSPSSSTRRSQRDPDERRRSDDHRHSGSSRRRARSRSRDDRRMRSRSRERNRYRNHDSRRHSRSSYQPRPRRYRSPSSSSSGSRERRRRRRTRDSSSSGKSSPSPSPPRSRSRSRSESQNQNHQQQQAQPQQLQQSQQASQLQPSQQQSSQVQVQVQPSQPVVLPAGIAQLPVVLRMPQMPQITKPARRVYVGGLPAVVDEARIATFFNHAMAVIEGNTYGQGGDAVVSVFIDHAKNYAFVEMRSVEEASNAMALDGIIFEGSQVRIRRPSNYNPEHAMLFGSSQPSPSLRLDKVGLVYRAHADGPDRIFIGGLPYEWGDAEVRQLLEPFGALRALDIVKDSYTRKSKGYGFAVYENPASTDAACAALNQKPLEGKILRVHRATNSSGNPALVLLPQSSELGTRVVCLCNAVSEEMLRDEKEYAEIIEDMKEECGKYGPLVSVEIPRGDGAPGLGKVFLEYKDLVSALKARHGLQGRSFDKRTVQATYYPEDKFSAKDYGG